MMMMMMLRIWSSVSLRAGVERVVGVNGVASPRAWLDCRRFPR